MKVFTFQHDWPNSHNEWKRQIWLWQQNWKQRGFEPIVLSLSDAQRHPLYRDLSAAVSGYPTVNDRVYEHACFVRHLAFDLAEAQLISDYDVINRNLYPDDVSRVVANQRRDPLRPTSLDAGGNVCLALFCGDSRRTFLDACLHPSSALSTAQTHNGRPHVSDMTVFMSVCKKLEHPYCDTWGNHRLLVRENRRFDKSMCCIHVNNDSLVQIGIAPGNKSTIMADLILGRRSFWP